jgi:hypothetical protein
MSYLVSYFLAQKKDVRRQSRERAPAEIKNQNSLPKIEPLPGAVCKQMKRCGKPNCKCAKGELHGPYYYRFVHIRGKQLKIYVKKSEFQAISAACSAYKRRCCINQAKDTPVE